MKVLCIEKNNTHAIPRDTVARYADTVEKTAIPPLPGKLDGIDAVIINADSIKATRDWITRAKKANPDLPIMLSFKDYTTFGIERQLNRSNRQHLQTLEADYVVGYRSDDTQELHDALRAIHNAWRRKQPGAGEQFSLADRVFADKADALGLKSVSLPGEITMDGQQYFAGDIKQVYVAPSPLDSAANHHFRGKEMGHYTRHNNDRIKLLSFVDENGALRIAADTNVNETKLCAAGYKSEGAKPVPCPFADNGGHLADPYLEERLQAMIGNTPIASAEAERLAGKVAAEKGIGAIDTSRFFRVDGTVYKKKHDPAYEHGRITVAKNTIGYGFSPPTFTPNPDRINHVGECCAENGVLGFIDPKGHLYIGPDNTENRKLLSDAHYTPGEFEVPYAHQKGELGQPITYAHLIPASGEPQVNDALRKRYQEVMGEAKARQTENAATR